jgi:hypothetical protein
MYLMLLFYNLFVWLIGFGLSDSIIVCQSYFDKFYQVNLVVVCQSSYDLKAFQAFRFLYVRLIKAIQIVVCYL